MDCIITFMASAAPRCVCGEDLGASDPARVDGRGVEVILLHRRLDANDGVLWLRLCFC